MVTIPRTVITSPAHVIVLVADQVPMTPVPPLEASTVNPSKGEVEALPLPRLPSSWTPVLILHGPEHPVMS